MKMHKIDKILFGTVVGVFFPFLLSWIAIGIGFYLFREHGMPYIFAAGLITGILADLLLIKRILANLFDLPYWLLAGFYILCNIFIYGTFMGFPVFNLAMGLVAGYYFGRRITVKNIISPERETLIRKISVFSAFIMILFCISSAFIGLHEKTIGEELQGMLGLDFLPEKGLIITGIIIGGSALIIIQYFITRIIIIQTAKKRNG
jgi:hypothetical protein